MKHKRTTKRANALIEMVVIMPLLMAMILMLILEFELMQTRHLSIEACHLGTWESVDYRNSTSDRNSLPNPRSRINDVLDDYDQANTEIRSLTYEELELDSMNSGVSGMLSSLLNMFGLNEDGKIHCVLQTDYTIEENNLIGGLLNIAGGSNLFTWSYEETLLVDPWDAPNPGGTTSGQVQDRVSGGWLGPIGGLGGMASGLSNILGLLGIDVPRVNLSSVPDR